MSPISQATTLMPPAFTQNTINLASPRLGAEALFATDDFFADKARLIQDVPASFDPNLYDDNGKYMDGWESRRRRHGGHDYCVVKLGCAGYLHGVDIDTSFFTGNYPPAASLEGCVCHEGDVLSANTPWHEILPASALSPSNHHYFAFDERVRQTAFTHLRLHIYPDGGVARLRVYGEPAPAKFVTGQEYEFSLAKLGARIVAYNDAHYGQVWTLLTEGRGINMGDGWETRRRREPGHDWILVKLATSCHVSRIIVDTCHYKGNFPDRCALQAALVEGLPATALVTDAMFWPVLMAEEKLQADHIHEFGAAKIFSDKPVNYVKLNIFPDGGISRLRIFGKVA